MTRKLVCFFVFVLCALGLHAQTVDSVRIPIPADTTQKDSITTTITDTVFNYDTILAIQDTIKKQPDTVRKPESVIASPKGNPNYAGYQITGVVKDRNTGEPIPFATVFFEKSAVGTTTDENGKFILQFEKFPADSIKVQVIGYRAFARKIDKTKKIADYELLLEQSSALLNEVVIKPGEDPAIVLMREVIRNKEKNDPNQAENYKYESYNKVEIDLLNFTRKKFERLPVPYLKQLGFIFDNMDSTSYNKPYLPMYLTEALSDYYFQKKPKKTKEFVKATQMKVVTNKNMTKSISQYLGKLYVEVNPYDNYLMFFNLNFVSPASNTALAFYRYKIVDTQELYGRNIITLEFKPQRQGENCFEGLIKIVDSVYAIQYIGADIPKSANVNWVSEASFYQEFAPIAKDSIWFCTKENLTAELELTEEMVKTIGVIVRKTTSYRNIIINDSSVTNILESKELRSQVTVADSAAEAGEDFWKTARHEELNENEQGIYDMYDSLDNNRSYQRLKTLVKILGTGGYKFGPIELGPYWSIYTNNQIESSRFQFNLGTTPKLFKNLYLNGYVAYGTGDKRYKYSGNAFWLIKRNPRMYLNFSYSKDIDYTVNYYDRVSYNNILITAIRKQHIPLKFMFAENARVEFYNENYNGFSQLLTVYRKVYDPYDPLPSTTVFRHSDGAPSETVTATEVNLRLRFAYKEKFLNGNYYRFSLGSVYPIIELRLAMGLKNVLGSDYDYKRAVMTISDTWKLPPFGELYVNVFGGKYWGTLPYPLLEQHPGNEFYYYNKYAFNMMNQYEFISDQFVGANLEHSLGGGLLKYIPLMKKLKWRQFWTAKGVVGTLSDANKNYNFNKGFLFRSLDGKPYVELGTGIENIFKVLRVDFVWRVTPKTLPNEPKRDFGILGSAKFSF